MIPFGSESNGLTLAANTGLRIRWDETAGASQCEHPIRPFAAPGLIAAAWKILSGPVKKANFNGDPLMSKLGGQLWMVGVSQD
jgi:hypothetical protein